MLKEFFAVIQNYDFDLLYVIQNLRCEFLDAFFLAVTSIAGNYGHIWVVLGLVLLIFKKTRACGIAILLSYGLVFLTGQLLLKDLIARPRPCTLNETVQLIVSRPTSFSCPSTHTAWAFGAVTAVFAFGKKWGFAALVPALIIAFSRLYLFVHFPTDVFLGAVLGILCGVIAVLIVKAVKKKMVPAANAA